MLTVSRTAWLVALSRCSCHRVMYLRHCQGDVGACRLVILFRKIEALQIPLTHRRPDGSNVGVAVISIASPGAAVGVAVRRCFFISAPHDTSFASTASLVLLRGLFWYYSRCCGCCPPFCCCLALGADGALTFEVTDTITKVTLEASRSRTIVCMAAPRPAISLHESERERARLSA